MAKKKKHKPDPKSWKIKRNRKGREHIDACSTGYPSTSNLFRQVHHIVCISSISDATIKKQLKDDDDVKFIRKCLKATVWNINAAHNCISLPLKRAFLDKRAVTGWDGFPCHLVDHNPHYTLKISEDLKKKVWEPSIEVAEECEFKGKNLATALKTCSDDWRTFLTNRGQGGDSSDRGTEYSWKNREKIKDTWYIPFSMHPGVPTKRKPPPDWGKFSGSMKKYLKKMFQAI